MHSGFIITRDQLDGVVAVLRVAELRSFRAAAQEVMMRLSGLRGGLKLGFVKMSAYGPMVPDAAKKQADDIKAKMIAGTFDIFKDGIKDNKGAVVVPAGKVLKQTDLELEKMNYLVEGVLGSV